LVRELWSQRTVTLLFFISLLFVVIRTALLSVPELFPGGARVGEVFFELAIAYIGAWFFNILVVILPRLHDRDAVMEGAGIVIKRIGTIGLRIRRDLKLPFEPEIWEEKMDSCANEVREKFKNLRLTDDAPLPIKNGAEIRMGNWREWVADKVREIDGNNASLIPYLSFLEIELIHRLNDVVLSDFVVMGRKLGDVELTGNTDIFSNYLPEFLDACENLRVYIARNPSLSLAS
jgi:hypothetical protein